MKTISIITVLATILVASTGFQALGQRHDYNWVSGNSSGSSDTNFGGVNINFNAWPPDTTRSGREMDFRFNSAAISDEEGQLLFYTNGCYINGRDDLPLMNGDSLNPGYLAEIYCVDGDGYRSTQGSLFLPHPTNPNLYYLIHLGLNWVDSIGGVGERLYYTLIDKTLDHGRGDVIVKNQVMIEDTLAVGIMTATRHANGRDWWVVATEMSRPRHFVFLLTPNGFEGPMEQTIGQVSFDDDGTGNACFSPDGSTYARFDWHNKANIFDFDRCTGQFSNPRHFAIPIPEDTSLIAGSAVFSPNSRYLYIPATWHIYQYDIWAADIKASEIEIATYEGGDVFFKPTFFSGQLGPDGRIYINAVGSSHDFHVIEMPNRHGLACKVKQSGFHLPTWNAASMCFFPNYRLGPLDNSFCDTLGLNNYPLANFRWDVEDTLNPLQVTFTDLSAYEVSSWQWDFGDNQTSQDTSPVHVFNGPGIYEVCQTVSNMNGQDMKCYEVPVDTIISLVESPRQKIDVKVMPNPFSNVLNIKLPRNLQGAHNIILFDSQGKKVAEKLWDDNVLIWDLSSLINGFYFYLIEHNGQLISNGKIFKFSD